MSVQEQIATVPHWRHRIQFPGGVMTPGRIARTGADATAPARLAVSLHDCAAIAEGTAVDTLVEAIVARRGRLFRAGTALLRGLSLAPDDVAVTGRSACAVGLVAGATAGFARRTIGLLIGLSFGGAVTFLGSARPTADSDGFIEMPQ